MCAFKGILDEVCLYDKALNASEISGIMSTGCVGSGDPPTPTPTANPGTTVDVYLAGTFGEETAELLIDDQVKATFTGVGTGYHSGQFIQFTYQHSMSVTANQIKVRLVDGGWASDGTTDMNLRVDKIVLNGMDYQSEAATTYSVGSWSSSNGCDPGYKQSDRLHCGTGYFWYEANVTPPPTPTATATATASSSTIEVYAAGSTDNTEVLSLLIDDQVVALYVPVGGSTLEPPVYEHYTYQHSSPVQAAQVKLRRSVGDALLPLGGLRIDRIVIDGVSYQTEAPTTYSSCRHGFPQTEFISCEGYFWYDQGSLPPTPTATPTATVTASPTPPPNEVTKIQRTYYSIAGQAVGVRVKKILDNGSTDSDNVYYMYTDHLGNVGALSDKNGSYISGSLTLFRPFGEYRRTPSTNPDITDRGYTGHAHNNSGDNNLGLIYMGARFYLPYLNRFISADSLVPDPMNPQQFNRYTYGLNNPMTHT